MTRDADSALLNLLMLLREQDYRFITPTPASHARVLARPGRDRAANLRDLLGWSLPFAPGTVDAGVEDLLRQAGMIEQPGPGLLKSRLRVSSLGDQMFLHSAYPTNTDDAVFFGPDSYRFADLITHELERDPLVPSAVIADIGAGAGVGGLVAARASEPARVILCDPNAQALRLARINARAAGVTVETVADVSAIDRPFDLAVINPPYLVDGDGRTYRHGGGMHGGEVPLAMTRASAVRLAPGGRVILYTGAAIVEGRNPLEEALREIAAEMRLGFRSRELDVDVFGEELAKPAYAEVERITLISVTLTRPS